MLAIAGQTAGPSWLNFFEGTQGYTEGDIGKKKFTFKIEFFLIQRATQGNAGQFSQSFLFNFSY